MLSSAPRIPACFLVAGLIIACSTLASADAWGPPSCECNDQCPTYIPFCNDSGGYYWNYCDYTGPGIPCTLKVDGGPKKDNGTTDGGRDMIVPKMDIDSHDGLIPLPSDGGIVPPHEQNDLLAERGGCSLSPVTDLPGATSILVTLWLVFVLWRRRS